MGLEETTTVSDLESFLSYIYENETGYIYLATKSPETRDWEQFFFEWPVQVEDVLSFIRTNRSKSEVYLAPAIFTEKDAHKQFVRGANVVWVEFDGLIPKDLQGVPEPTCRIRSSFDSNEHWYWKLDQFTAPDELERINRALTYKFGADSSGWDCNQVLRPPETFNHKKKKEVSLVSLAGSVVLGRDLFVGLPDPPPLPEAPLPTEVPQVEHVIMKYALPEKVRALFMSGSPDRSDGLMALGYYGAEMGMSQGEILAVLLNADERWGKFKGRPDRMTRLMEIVTRAKMKYPTPVGIYLVEDRPGPKLVPYGLKTLLATEVQLEWQWTGLLQRAGYILVTGPSQVGKTQFSLNGAAALALGKPFLDRETRQARIGFFSLEMGLTDVKHFLQSQAGAYSPEELDILEDNLQIFPLGEPLYLSNDAIRKEVEEIVGDLKLGGIVIDSLGSATDEEVSDEKVKRHFHWNDQFRQRTGCFTWYIHHHRKATGDNKRPNKLSDVYGSQYITSYATTVLGLWPGSSSNSVQLLPLKVRLAECPPPFYMQRNSLLNFTRIANAQVQLVPSEPADSDGQSSVQPLHTTSSGPSGVLDGLNGDIPTSFNIGGEEDDPGTE